MSDPSATLEVRKDKKVVRRTVAQVPRLSKSKFQAGLQCPKRLWLVCHRPDLADSISEAKQAVFDIGHRVGELARTRFPGGVLVAEDHTQSDAALGTTARLIEDDASCLYEAAFGHDAVLVRVDVLRHSEERYWQLIEVKAGTSLKSEYITDAAIQTYVLRGDGLPVGETISASQSGLRLSRRSL